MEFTLEELQTIERGLEALFYEEPWPELISAYEKVKEAIKDLKND